VAGGVDDIDARALPLHARALGENGDAAFLFEVVRIHGAFLDALIVAEGAGLAEQLVDKGGLAVVDVRNDSHVPKSVGVEAHRSLLVFRGVQSRCSGVRRGP
jgi:hypothetical protein